MKITQLIFALIIVGITSLYQLQRAFSQELSLEYLNEIEDKLENIGSFDRICSSISDFESNKGRIVQVKHESFSHAIHVSIPKAGNNPWDITLKSKHNNSPINEGDIVVTSFFVRCLESDNTGLGKINAIIEQSPKWFGFGTWEGEFDMEWTPVSIIGQISKPLNDNKVFLSIHCADRKQEIEFAGLTLHVIRNNSNKVDIQELKKAVSTPLNYKGIEPSAKWRKEANQRIDEIRKQDFEIAFKNHNNKSIKNLTVKLKLTNHEFGFGTFLGSLDPKYTKKFGEENLNRYLNLSKTYFNRYTVPMYWANWATWGWPDKSFEEGFKFGLEWATRSGHAVRGHVPLWLSYKYKPFFKELENNPQLMESKIEEHLDFVFNHELVNGKLTDWDLINEVYNNHQIIDLLPNGEKSITKWYDRVQKIDTTTHFFINDYGILNQDKAHQKGYYDLLQRMTERETKYDGFGMQGHINGAIPPETILATYDRFSIFNKPIHITELDFVFDLPEDNAKYMEDFLTATFSHPNLEAIIIWGFWKPAKGTWRPNFYFFDEDFNETAVSKTWKKMTKEVWYTEIDTHTNKTGRLKSRGFKGQYLLETTIKEQTKKFAINISEQENNFEINDNLIFTPNQSLYAGKDIAIQFNIEETGTYQIGVNGQLSEKTQAWYTPNLQVRINDELLVQINLLNQKEGITKRSIHFEKGKHIIHLKWDKFEQSGDQNLSLLIQNIYLIQVLN